MDPNQDEARTHLGLASTDKLCALMPGSRRAEVEQLLPIMLEAAEILRVKLPDLTFAIPMANAEREAQIRPLLTNEQRSYIHLYSGQSHEVMTASNCVVMASGTTTLEAMLLKKPMVITYRWPAWTWGDLGSNGKSSLCWFTKFIGG